MTTSLVDNGANVEALVGARDAFADTPEIAQFQWRSTVTWINGTHSCAGVDAFFGFGEAIFQDRSANGWGVQLSSLAARRGLQWRAAVSHCSGDDLANADFARLAVSFRVDIAW